MPIRDLRPLALVVAAMVVIDALWQPFILAYAGLFPAAFSVQVAPIASTVDIVQFAFKILTMIVFGSWIYLAGVNLVNAGFGDLEFSPASRIWWFAVPIASLFRPFQGMRELWNASRDVWPHDSGDWLIGTWWGLWLLKGIAATIAGLANSHGSSGITDLWVTSFLGIAVAAPALALVRGITRAQAGFDQSSLGEVFA